MELIILKPQVGGFEPAAGGGLGRGEIGREKVLV